MAGLCGELGGRLPALAGLERRVRASRTSTSTSSPKPCCAATCSGVRPSSSASSRVAPMAMRYLATSRWPFSSASTSGVLPCASDASISSCLRRRSFTRARSPTDAARARPGAGPGRPIITLPPRSTVSDAPFSTTRVRSHNEVSTTASAHWGQFTSFVETRAPQCGQSRSSPAAAPTMTCAPSERVTWPCLPLATPPPSPVRLTAAPQYGHVRRTLVTGALQPMHLMTKRRVAIALHFIT